jgi:hypothetical protein
MHVIIRFIDAANAATRPGAIAKHAPERAIALASRWVVPVVPVRPSASASDAVFATLSEESRAVSSARCLAAKSFAQHIGVEMHRRCQDRILAVESATLGFGEIVFVLHGIGSSRYCRASFGLGRRAEMMRATLRSGPISTQVAVIRLIREPYLIRAPYPMHRRPASGRHGISSNVELLLPPPIREASACARSVDKPIRSEPQRFSAGEWH